MKTVGRILIILMVALIVVGATYAVSQASATQALIGQPIGQGASEDRPALSGFANGQNAPAGEMRGSEREGRGGSFEIVWQNLLKIAAVVMVVQIVWSIGQRMKRAAERTNRWQWGRSS
jgi:hypothetical protein